MLDIFTHLLPHVGKTVLHQGNRPNVEEYDNGNRRCQPVLHTATAAFKGELIDVAKQYIRVTRLCGGTNNWRTSLNEQIDQVKVIKVIDIGRDQKRSNGDQKQWQCNAAESCPTGGPIDHRGFVNVCGNGLQCT